MNTGDKIASSGLDGKRPRFWRNSLYEEPTWVSLAWIMDAALVAGIAIYFAVPLKWLSSSDEALAHVVQRRCAAVPRLASMSAVPLSPGAAPSASTHRSLVGLAAVIVFTLLFVPNSVTL